MGDGRQNQPAVILKADEAAVKQVVDARRQKKPVLAVDALFVAGIAPRFAVTGYQMDRVGDARYAAAVFNLHLPVFEKPLAPPRPNYCLSIRVSHRGVRVNRGLDL